MKKYKVYKHIFPNNKIYIGITSYKNVNQRWKCGVGYINQPVMKNAINKYGWENIKHEILFDNLTKEEAEQKEIELIAFYKSNEKQYGYNVQSGGNLRGELSEEGRSVLSNKMKGNKNPMKDEKIKQKFIQKIKGKKISDKTKKLMSKNSKRKIKIFCITTNEIFDSITQASKKFNIDTSCIIHCCKGVRYSTGGYRFSYLDNIEYIKNIKNKNLTKVKCVETGEIFNSVKEACKKYNYKTSSCITNVLHGRTKSIYGKHWIIQE